MRLEFASPLLAWFAPLAGLVPLVVHLLHRHKVVTTLFPPAFLLLAAMKKRAKRDRLRNLLLLLTRMVLAAGIVLAAAGPSLVETEGRAASKVQGPKALAVVIDDSASMLARVGRGTIFDRAKDAARKALSRLEKSDSAALMTTSSAGKGQLPALEEPGRVLEKLEAVGPGYGRNKLNRALRAAAALLTRKGKHRSGEILLLTDRAAHALDFDESPWREQDRPDRISIVRLDDPESLDNISVTSVEASESGTDQASTSRFSVKASVSCRCREGRRELPVRLMLDGSLKATRFVDIEPGGTVQVEFDIAVDEPGFHFARVEIESTDPLSVDDSASAVIRVGKKRKLLLVDGEPSSIPFQDEVFYLERALDPTRGTDPMVSLRVIDPEDLANQDLNRFDALFLCNVPAENLAGIRPLLEAFAGSGGGIFVSVGNKVEPAEYDKVMGSLMPRNLVGTSGTGSVKASYSIRVQESTSTVLKPLAGEAEISLASVKVWRWLSAAPGRKGKGTVLLSLNNGAPLFLEGRFGKGRLLTLLTTVDRDWTDLPISPAYLPLMQRAAMYLSGDFFLDGENQVVVGKPRKIGMTGRIAAVTIVAPGGSRERITVEHGDSLVFRKTSIPGEYRVEVGGKVVDAFAVLPAPEESDLARLPEGALESYLSQGKDDVVAVRNERGNAETMPLWGWFLLACAAAVASESLLRSSSFRANWHARSRIRPGLRT